MVSTEAKLCPESRPSTLVVASIFDPCPTLAAAADADVSALSVMIKHVLSRSVRAHSCSPVMTPFPNHAL
jgi:hypothetical protein